MTGTRIIQVPIVPHGIVNAFVVSNGKNFILVDTGFAGSVRKFETAIKAAGLVWENLQAIVLTHGHMDHAGSALAIRNLTGAPIIAHRDEFPYLSGQPPVVKATKGFGRLFRLTGMIERTFPYFVPDVGLSEPSLDLSVYGLDATIISTPGHTPGSVSVILQDGRAIAGDLMASGILLGGIAFKERPKQPPFEEDSREVAVSLRRLVNLGATSFYLGHGGPLSLSATRKHLAALEKVSR